MMLKRCVVGLVLGLAVCVYGSTNITLIYDIYSNYSLAFMKDVERAMTGGGNRSIELNLIPCADPDQDVQLSDTELKKCPKFENGKTHSLMHYCISSDPFLTSAQKLKTAICAMHALLADHVRDPVKTLADCRLSRDAYDRLENRFDDCEFNYRAIYEHLAATGHATYPTIFIDNKHLNKYRHYYLSDFEGFFSWYTQPVSSNPIRRTIDEFVEGVKDPVTRTKFLLKLSVCILFVLIVFYILLTFIYTIFTEKHF